MRQSLPALCVCGCVWGVHSRTDPDDYQYIFLRLEANDLEWGTSRRLHALLFPVSPAVKIPSKHHPQRLASRAAAAAAASHCRRQREANSLGERVRMVPVRRETLPAPLPVLPCPKLTLRVHVCVYACVHAERTLHACVYVCIHACLYVFVHGSIYPPAHNGRHSGHRECTACPGSQRRRRTRWAQAARPCRCAASATCACAR